ncbi:GntR family transcriptional regulator [Nakamurella flava]|uniref:GntR family transcriptional regulator n=1 Tax=Nakamurella flava TaxID=2576308 RepID=A0A4U6QEC8_9ACTN|nr:GntR family transcriptional regulator [Nakamurella flava]TKV58411.1 GntR family transcriptional regulator [Nakamurella flava]
MVDEPTARRGAGGRQRLSDKAASYVRGLIMSGQLRPGAGVRPEIVGQALGISATPAREALQALRVEGFLLSVPQQGFQVAPLTGQDIRDLFQAQALIAGELAARAARAATQSQVRELEALHHELIAAAARNDHPQLEEKNHAFHREINLVAGSPRIAGVLGMLTRYVPHDFYAEITGWPRATIDDHEQILRGIQIRDADHSRQAMQRHITHAGELLARHFEERSPDGAGLRP